MNFNILANFLVCVERPGNMKYSNIHKHWIGAVCSGGGGEKKEKKERKKKNLNLNLNPCL